MIRCPHCNAQLTPDSTAADLASSPPDEMSLDDCADWSPVARTSSVAEAGFLCDLLVDAQVNAQLQELDDFDAISGAWHKMFVVVVPQVQAGQAAERLQREIDGSAEDEDSQDEPSSEPERTEEMNRHPVAEVARDWPAKPISAEIGYGKFSPAARGNHVPDDFFLETSRGQSQATAVWLAVAMALVAGGVASWIASDWLTADGRANHSTEQSLLWNALKESGGSWESLGQPPPGRRELRYDEASDVFFLEEDLNGDRSIDRRREFHAGAE